MDTVLPIPAIVLIGLYRAFRLDRADRQPVPAPDA
jgi:hypothetical protein